MNKRRLWGHEFTMVNKGLAEEEVESLIRTLGEIANISLDHAHHFDEMKDLSERMKSVVNESADSLRKIQEDSAQSAKREKESILEEVKKTSESTVSRAKEAAQSVKQEAEETARGLVIEANERAKGIVMEAKEKALAIVEAAREYAEAVYSDSNEEAEALTARAIPRNQLGSTGKDSSEKKSPVKGRHAELQRGRNGENGKGSNIGGLYIT